MGLRIMGYGMMNKCTKCSRSGDLVKNWTSGKSWISGEATGPEEAGGGRGRTEGGQGRGDPAAPAWIWPEAGAGNEGESGGEAARSSAAPAVDVGTRAAA